MKVVPPNLSMVCLEAMVLLQLLEAATEMGYCRICCQPSPRCRCEDDSKYAPMETWSQLMARMPGQGGAASIGGPTAPGTATTGVQEWGVPPPPPGLHPPDFTNWSLPLPEAPATGGLSMPSGGLPGIRRQTVGPWALGQKALAPPMQMPSARQGTLPLHQSRPHQPAAPYQQAAQLQSQPAAPHEQPVQPSSQPATLYQQAVQPPRRLSGRGLLARPPQTEPLLHLTKPSLTVEGNRLGDGASEADQPVTPDGAKGRQLTLPQLLPREMPSPNPAIVPGPDAPVRQIAAKNHSSGWRRDLEHVLKVYYKHTIQTPFREREWARVRECFFDHLTPRKAEVVAIKEESPLDYMSYIAEEFEKATGLCLNGLPEFTLWIK